MIRLRTVMFFGGVVAVASFSGALICGSSMASAPQVVVTLKPLHSLVASLMKGRGKPVLLLEGALSPHTAQLRPQQLVFLKKADLVVWVGPTFETFLSKSIEALSEGRSLPLLREEDLIRLPQGEAPCCSEHHEAGFVHQHDPDFLWDGHLWMSPLNGIMVARIVAKHLGRLDPEGRSVYEDNLLRLEKSLRALDEEIALKLAPFKNRDFLVAHQAYAYFVDRYHLRRPKALLMHPEQSIRPQERRMLSQPLKGMCVFFEPQLRVSLPKAEDRVVSNGGIVSELDPLGAHLPEGPGMFEALLRQCTQAMVTCFSQKR